MGELTWSERQVVDELAGALVSVAALVAFRPEISDRMRAAVVASLGDAEKEMVEKIVDPARLLPPGGEVSTQVLWPRFGESGLRRQRVIVWPDGSRYFGPAEPHPVVSDNSEGESSD